MRQVLIVLTIILNFNLMTAQSAFPSQISNHRYDPIMGAANTDLLSTPIPTQETDIPTGPPRSLTLAMLAFCCVFSLLIGVFVLGILVQVGNRKEMEKKNAQKSD